MNERVVRLQDFGVGTRIEGAKLRAIVVSMLDINPNEPVVLDFSGVTIIGAGFADELIGKLLVQWGLYKMLLALKLTNTSSIVQSVIDLVCAQRMTELT